jgi:hypothetical protein
LRTLSLLESVSSQILRVQRQIETLETSDFPYEHSKEALLEMRNVFDEHAELLSGVTSGDDEAVVGFHAIAASKNIRDLLPILGFILRSTNVRNAFEIWGPLWRLSCQVLQKEARLLLSSEWAYSPYTFIGCAQLPGFVLIGLPATESSNPFLIPLAGHELGHSVWRERNLKHEVLPPLQQHILDVINSRDDEYTKIFPGIDKENRKVGSLGWQTWEPAETWALRQAEECFCDFLGLRLFGEAFLHSSVYLLAPIRKGVRSYIYPNNIDRAQALAQASEKYRVRIPENFIEIFADLSELSGELIERRFLLSVADAARKKLHPLLMDIADRIINESEIPAGEPSKIATCKEVFRSVVPVENSGGLANILNAGWEARLENDFFRDSAKKEEQESLLAELILKSIEILEVEKRLSGGL